MSLQYTENKDESEEVGKSSTAVAIVPIQQTGDIFKLDIDCFEEAFDYLRLKDLVSVGLTCKRLQQVAGYCFQQNYSNVTKTCTKDGVHLFVFDGENVNCFIPFINRITLINRESLGWFRSKQSKFVRLKEMTFFGLYVRSNDGECVRDKLRKLEVLRMVDCCVKWFFYDTILKFSINLKRLIIIHGEHTSVLEYGWLLKKYPKLEYLEYISYFGSAINELVPFFELNPTVQIFSTDSYLLCNNRAAMMSGKVKLDNLAIYVDFYDGNETRRFCEMLNEMYDLGVYKRLHLYFSYYHTKQEMVDEILTLKSLVKLYIGSDSWEPVIVSLPILNDLQEIHIDRSENIINFEDVPSKFSNLKRVHLKYANSNQLLMFISRAVNLMKIQVDHLRPGLNFDENDNTLDLVGLNKERQKLNEAEKVTIYVDEEVYLPTKWAMKGTDFSHIVMRRATSYDWNHSFYHEY